MSITFYLIKKLLYNKSMNVNDIIQIISSVGFPIVCSLIMFYLVYTLNKSFQNEIKQLSESLNQNTLILSELKTLMEDIRNGRKDT